MLGPREVRAAVRAGALRAQEIIRERQPPRPTALLPPFGGYLIAEGDSWFSYPLHEEVVEKLEERFNYRIESAARWGDTAENIAYNDGGQGRALLRPFERLAQDKRLPRAILLSCGGNDLTGEDFSIVLDHARSLRPGLNAAIVEGIMERLEASITTLISLVRRLGQATFRREIPVVIHGYGYPVPDGRGFFGGAWLLPGPWLAPGFTRKGYNRLPERCRIMKDLIDEFNAVLRRAVAHFTSAVHVDVRPVLSSTLRQERYKNAWANELHPTGRGFEAVARRFDRAIRKFPMP
jgi:hypothetical protein